MTFRKKPNRKIKGIKTCSKRKRKLFIGFQKYRSDSAITTYNKYKTRTGISNNSSRSTIRYSKRKMNINYVTKSTNKDTWNTIKQSTTTNEITATIKNLENNEGNVTNSTQIPERLNMILHKISIPNLLTITNPFKYTKVRVFI